MKILAIDTAVGISVALHDGNTVVAEATRVEHGVQGELTTMMIAELLAQAGWTPADLTDVVVGVGPGPYTGLRVGIVTATVFGHARGIPVHGICSLDAVGHDAGGECIVVTDARRKELYWARYDGGRVDGPHVMVPAELADAHPNARFVGPGAQLYPDVVAGEVMELRAGALAELFATGTAQLVDVAPMYLRIPDAVAGTVRKKVGP